MCKSGYFDDKSQKPMTKMMSNIVLSSCPTQWPTDYCIYTPVHVKKKRLVIWIEVSLSKPRRVVWMTIKGSARVTVRQPPCFLCVGKNPKGSLTCGCAGFCCSGLEEKDSRTKLFGSIKRGNISSWMRDPLKQRVLNWWCHNKTISRGVDRCWCAGPLSRDYYLFTLLNHSLPDATRTPLRSVCWGRGVCSCVCVCLWYGYNQECSGSALAVCAPDMTPGQTLLVSNPRTDFQLMEKPIIDLHCLFQRHFNHGRPTVHAHICRKLLLLEALFF